MDQPPAARTLPHPHPRDYVRIAVVLAVVTGMEVSLYYLPRMPVTVPLLVVLMGIKFALVALWFMHLRFDQRFLSRLFVTGIVLAIVLYTIVLLAFRVLF